MTDAYLYLKLKFRKINFIHDKKYGDSNLTRFDFYIPSHNTYIEVTGYNKDGLKKGRWFKYLRQIAKKRRYVHNVLKANFRFIQLRLNKNQFIKIRENMK